MGMFKLANYLELLCAGSYQLVPLVIRQTKQVYAPLFGQPAYKSQAAASGFNRGDLPLAHSIGTRSYRVQPSRRPFFRSALPCYMLTSGHLWECRSP